jgi:hypothetical protein
MIIASLPTVEMSRRRVIARWSKRFERERLAEQAVLLR